MNTSDQSHRMATVQAYLQAAQTLKAQGQLNDAIGCLNLALAMDPDSVSVLYNLGNTHKQAGSTTAAQLHYERALLFAPDSPEVNFNLGNLHLAAENMVAASSHFAQVIKAWPSFAPAHSNLALAQDATGQHDSAMDSHQLALQFAAHSSVVHVNYGVTLIHRARYSLAESALRHALVLDPTSASAYCALGQCLQHQNRIAEAADQFEQALRYAPDSPVYLCARAENLNAQGQLDACVAMYERAMALKPGMALASSNLLFVLAYRATLTPHAYLARARGHMAALQRDLPKPFRDQALETPVFEVSASVPQNRRLRVGYISGDFRHDAVSFFIKQVLAEHDLTRIDLVLYNNTPSDDSVTAALKSVASEWYEVRGMADSALVAYIRAHKIDVLIDLSGHVAHNRLGVLANRVAPVQAHYLGYFASTGLAEMDYWIADERLVPPAADSHFSETVWRLPRVWVSYQGRDDAPAVAWWADPVRVLRIGSFNNLAKITDSTLTLWARLLRRLPGAILVLKTKTLEDTVVQQRILGILKAQGVDAARLELLGRTTSWNEHMAQYNSLDVALDPVGGVGGGTTTCDALWMGVPVVTLQGESMAQRMTASMLDALGHPEWIATNEDEYVNTVVTLATDPSGREALRAAQRDKMRRSPLCDAKRLARALEDAYFAMHARHTQSGVNHVEHP